MNMQRPLVLRGLHLSKHRGFEAVESLMQCIIKGKRLQRSMRIKTSMVLHQNLPAKQQYFSIYYKTNPDSYLVTPNRLTTLTLTQTSVILRPAKSFMQSHGPVKSFTL